MEDQQQKKYQLMTETPVSRLIPRMALPCVVSMLVTAFYNMADTFFVGMLKSNAATGAVGVVFSLMAIIQALGFMLGHGAGGIISRSLGSQNTDAAETALMVEQLGDLIRTNLRQCDVGARYTDMQYVVMLSGSTAESGTSPLERIKAAFYRIPAHGRYLLSYSLYVPEAKADSGRARRRKKTAKKEK